MLCSRSSALLLLLIVALIPVSADVRPIKGAALAGPKPVQYPSGSPADIAKLSGDYKLIVILVEFTDIKHQKSRDDINQMVFSRMNQYWHEVSYGKFNVIGDTVGWINLGRDEGYYGKDTDPKDPGSDQGRSELIADACRLTKGVDFSGYQDIMVVYAGHGQAEYAYQEVTTLLWPWAYASGLDVTCGSRKYGHGGLSAEVGEAGLAFGIFTHEFGHTIGLPDLYNTASDAPDYWKTGIDYVGFWSLMAEGDWGGPNDDASNGIGLEAWSRIKLGWLSSVPVRPAPDPFLQTLHQLGDTTDPRVLRIATKGTSYYLVEVREKTGVDEYLRDSGVLITRIDESKDWGHGIVTVNDCHPETKTIDDATCKVNESWSDKSNEIYVKVIGEQGTDYVIGIASKPVSTAAFYQVTLSIEPSISGAKITLDGSTYDSQQLPATFAWTVGSQHVLEVEDMVEDGSGIRYVFAEWNDGQRATTRTVTASSSVTFAAKFKTQYLLTVKSPMGDPQGSGWYDEGSMAQFSVRSPLPLEGFMGMLGGKYVLDHWSGNSTSTTPTTSFAMNEPKTVTAEWRVDNTMPYIVISAIAAVIIVATLLLLTRRRKAQSSVSGEQKRFAEPERQPPPLSSNWCISCGKEILQQSIFCEHCGARQPE